MTDREAFLRAIRAHPDDDTPRLIYADWLEERGDPAQAEFVRLQVELEPIRDQLDQPRVRELAERESILLATHGHDWLGPAADLVGPYPAFGPVFRRGLPEMVCLSLDTFLDRAEEMFPACPTVREVCVYGVQGRGAELAAYPQLGQVETLEIADPRYMDDLNSIAALCHAVRDARLRCFRIPDVLDPPLFHSLGRVIASGWPRWVEFVRYIPGDRNISKEFAAALDSIAGRPVTRIVCPYEKLFSLDGDLGNGLIAGHLAHGTPAIVAANARYWLIHTFDEDGKRVNVTGDTERGFRTPDGGGDVLGWVRAHRGFEPGYIAVHAFEADWSNLAIRLWPQTYINELLDPSDRPPGVSDHWWESRGGVLKRWLHEGRFVIEWDGREYTADATGKIIAG